MHTVQGRKAVIDGLRKGAQEPAPNGSGEEAKEPVRMMIPIEKLKPNPDQARQTWDTSKDETGKTALDRLADSIRNQGLLTDLIVAPQEGYYQIVCGERRYRAIKNHNLMKEVPCIVRSGLSPVQKLELNIVENLQREDLTAMDEAHAYKALMEKCGYTQAMLSTKLGISAAMVSYKLSLLDLSPGLQKQVATGKISETDGRTIAQTIKRIEGPQQEEQRKEALKAIEEEIEKEPVNAKTGKVETPAVKRVAQAAVTQVAGAKALPKARAPRAVASVAPAAPVEPAKASAAVKEAGEHLMKAIKDVHEILKPSRRSLADGKTRKAVIGWLLTQYPDLPYRVRTAISPLDMIHGEAIEAINVRARAKAAAKEEKPSKATAKASTKGKSKTGKKHAAKNK